MFTHASNLTVEVPSDTNPEPIDEPTIVSDLLDVPTVAEPVIRTIEPYPIGVDGFITQPVEKKVRRKKENIKTIPDGSALKVKRIHIMTEKRIEAFKKCQEANRLKRQLAKESRKEEIAVN